jgi:hypothetical protein
VKTLEDMAMKRAASAEAASMNKMKEAGETTAQAGKAEAKPEQLAPKKWMSALWPPSASPWASIGAMVTGILTLFVGMGIWIPVGVLGILLLYPALHDPRIYEAAKTQYRSPAQRRRLGGGNSRLKVNVPFGGSLSHLAALPPGASRQMADPIAEKKKPWGLYFTILLLVGVLIAAYFLGWLGFIPGLGR